MKNPLALLLAAVLPLAGCASLSAPGTTPPVVVVAPLVPASTRAAIVALIAKHPEAKPFLVTIANSLQSIANVNAQLPDPDGTLGALVQWTTLLPQVGSYIADFMLIYRQAYPVLHQSGAVMAEIAEIVRSGTLAP